ncbi:unnamed protein product [Boreogadus saida]
MSRKKLAWANKEVETFVCILGEEDVVYDVYVAAAAIDIRPTTKDNAKGSVLSRKTLCLRRDACTRSAPRSTGTPTNGDAIVGGGARKLRTPI